MREIDASQVTEAIAKLCVEANCFLAEDVRCALCTAERQEPFAPCLLYTSGALAGMQAGV